MNIDSKRRKTIGVELFDIVKDHHKENLPKPICNEIELLALNDEEINVIRVNYEMYHKYERNTFKIWCNFNSFAHCT